LASQDTEKMDGPPKRKAPKLMRTRILPDELESQCDSSELKTEEARERLLKLLEASSKYAEDEINRRDAINATSSEAKAEDRFTMVYDAFGARFVQVCTDALDEGGWYDDTIVNAYGWSLFKEIPSVVLATSYLMLGPKTAEELLNDTRYQRAFYNREFGDTVRMIVVPINYRRHWWIIVVDVVLKKIIVLDSLASRDDERMKLKYDTCSALLKYLNTRKPGWLDIPDTEWAVHQVPTSAELHGLWRARMLVYGMHRQCG
jgi:Ulp1 protease family, C-terminal catalytic domain